MSKRKEERKDFPEFYQYNLKIIRDNKLSCEECGTRLLGDVSEVAHILNKSFFKSVSTDQNNIVYLCSWKSTNNCHSKFDNDSIEKVQQMNIFSKARKLVEKLKPKIKEKLNYKFYDRWQI